jgi:hypothetical protein
MNNGLFATDLNKIMKKNIIRFWNMLTRKNKADYALSNRSTLSWQNEHSFWFKKHGRAFIRFQIAVEAGDENAMDIASEQMALYRRRMKAVIPNDVAKEWDRTTDAERLAAINDQ